ncbi:MAG: response regulator [Leptolyngbyaceae cyanobacterium bins.302]|nr:response regulator [Leptolyngbyaceae cyanobacterium bins.302]
MKILLIEDDQNTGEFLTSILTAHRYTVDLANDGQIGLELASLWKYDLILLDLELPKLDGISVCRELRTKEDATPILMLTGKSQNNDIVLGLDAGADDYMVKPYDANQLLARIRALLRRGGKVPATVLIWGELCLDPALAQVTHQQRYIPLGPKEYNLLELFLRNPQRIFNRSAILDNLWTANDFPTENAVTNLIKDLRRKLKAAGMKEDLIETIYGLGYRLKSSPGEIAKEVELTRRQEGIDSINQLTEQFRSSLDKRLLFLIDSLRSLQLGELHPPDRETARQEAHRLAGTLGMFGYEQGTETVRWAEQLLQAEAPIPAQIESAVQGLATLQHTIPAPPDQLPLLEIPPNSTLLTVLCVTHDSELTEILQREETSQGVHIQVFSLSEVDLHCLKVSPAVMLMQWSGLKHTEAVDLDSALSEITDVDPEILVTRQLREYFPTVPLLILADEDNLANRVLASRLGCQRYLCKPVRSGQVWDAIAQVNRCALSQQSLKQVAATVLVVDDDPFVLSTITSLLQPWGVKVIELSEPERFWAVLTQINPDLLVLDVDLPKFSGIDFCRVVRQDLFYTNLPILVITAHRDAIQVQQVFDAGADDLICKPIVGSELVTRIVSRIERARLRQQLEQVQQQQTETLQQESRIDALTQIANRRRFNEFLAREWHYHQQTQMTLSLILCDVDHFKQFNDRYGHLAGDTCLRQIAQVIQTCINPAVDLVARYGGEEFGVILPNTDLNGALRVSRRIQDAIANLAIPHAESSVSRLVTLSMGITGTIPTPEQAIEELITTADQALYAAKDRGRNTYCLYPL